MLFARSAARALSTPTLTRHFSASGVHHTKVAVLGAGGGIGQPLSLLLKNDPLVSALSLYDIRGAPGVAADVSHVDTGSEVYLLCTLGAGLTDPCGSVTCRFMGILLTSWIMLWKASRSLSFQLVSPERCAVLFVSSNLFLSSVISRA